MHGGLRSLTALTMQRNELAVVPEAITALENLEVLDLSQNLVTSLDNLRVSPAIVIVIFQFRYVNVLFALYNVYNSCIV